MTAKKIFHSLCLVTALSVTIMSCKKDDDPEPNPINGSSVNYTGNWKCNETSSANGNSVYYVTITKSSTDSSRIFFQNFYGLGTSVKAIAITNDNYFSFIQQVLAGNQLESGAGNIMGNSITMTYVINTGVFIDSCSATLTRQ